MPAIILQRVVPDPDLIEYQFCLLLDGFYTEFRKRKAKGAAWLDRLHLLLGVQTLLHVYRVGWSRGYAIRPILVLCKNAQMYFFEYLSQWNDMGLPLRHSDMLVFIYDRVLDGTRSDSIVWKSDGGLQRSNLEKQSGEDSSPKNMESIIDRLGIILANLPDIEAKTSVRTFEKIFQTPYLFHGEKCLS
jgi:hypothetical protein